MQCGGPVASPGTAISTLSEIEQEVFCGKRHRVLHTQQLPQKAKALSSGTTRGSDRFRLVEKEIGLSERVQWFSCRANARNATMTTLTRTQVTVEAERMMIMRRPALIRSWCPQCDRKVDTIGWDETELSGGIPPGRAPGISRKQEMALHRSGRRVCIDLPGFAPEGDLRPRRNTEKPELRRTTRPEFPLHQAKGVYHDRTRFSTSSLPRN